MSDDKETDNVVPFYRFPEPPAKPVKISREDYFAQIEGFVVDDFSRINNPLLLKIYMLIEAAKADWRPNGVLTFSSTSAVEWDNPAYYAPDPIPPFCYEVSTTLSWGTRLTFEFYGRDDVKARDIAPSERPAGSFLALTPQSLPGYVQVDRCLEDLYERFRTAVPTQLLLPETDDSEIARFVFSQYDHTYLVVRANPWKAV